MILSLLAEEAEEAEESTNFFVGLWEDIKTFFTTNYWGVIWFVVALVLGIIIIKLLMKLFKRIFSHTKIALIAQQFILTIIRLVLWVILILILLGILGIDLSGAVTALSAVILAIGLALEDCLANVADGLILVSSKIINKGDYISANDVEGTVVNINFLFTTIDRYDGKRISIPNSAMVSGNIINYGATGARRIDFSVSVAYETDIELVKQVAYAVMYSDGRIYQDVEGKKPFCSIQSFDNSGIGLALRCWCDQQDYWDVFYYVNEHLYNEFKRCGITIPFTQIEMRERKDEVVMPVIPEPLPERVEKNRPQAPHRFDLENDSITEYVKNQKAKYDATKEANAEKAAVKAEEKAEEKAKKEAEDAAKEAEDEASGKKKSRKKKKKSEPEEVQIKTSSLVSGDDG